MTANQWAAACSGCNLSLSDLVRFNNLHNFDLHWSELFRFFQWFSQLTAFRLHHDANKHSRLFHEPFELLICLWGCFRHHVIQNLLFYLSEEQLCCFNLLSEEPDGATDVLLAVIDFCFSRQIGYHFLKFWYGFFSSVASGGPGVKFDDLSDCSSDLWEVRGSNKVTFVIVLVTSGCQGVNFGDLWGWFKDIWGVRDGQFWWPW